MQIKKSLLKMLCSNIRIIQETLEQLFVCKTGRVCSTNHRPSLEFKLIRLEFAIHTHVANHIASLVSLCVYEFESLANEGLNFTLNFNVFRRRINVIKTFIYNQC